MNEKVRKLLEGKGGNYILPFFWQHGETEEVLREYMGAIDACGIGAVCVESRPHPDYCGPKWWQDMDVILEEAEKRDMQVWILDDSHFPTGYCNGALKDGPDELRRQSITYRVLCGAHTGERTAMKREEYRTPGPFVKTMIEEYKMGEYPVFADDVFLGVVAVRKGGEGEADLYLVPETEEGFAWTAPEGDFLLYGCYLTRNRGPHRDYMNMMDAASCRKLIEAVYEPHYARYKKYFGKTIAGFFSDEPEIGNGHLYEMGKTMEEVDDQPWSREVEAAVRERFGEDWVKYMPLLWDQSFGFGLKSEIRHAYMDIVTRCVERDFSWQIGDWCRAHGVEYIGHLIEDNNQHSRCGSSLGHFFRGLAGQDMAGIDDIGGQVLPQGEDIKLKTFMGGVRDGVFFHYALGKLAASAAAIEPLKKGRAMCEIFGNYGWKEGVSLEKYLAEHFMVRGINRFVPHAFSPKEFPDPDCPPHFYAHGHNPQYRHFGALMRYMNRICELISDGYAVVPAAILYHGDADWAGGKCMYSQVPARILADHQIEYHFLPSDVFAEEKYRTELGRSLRVNGQEYRILIVPEASYITKEAADAVDRLLEQGFPVVFLNSLPERLCGRQLSSGAPEGSAGGGKYTVISSEELVGCAERAGAREIAVTPREPLLRYLHYRNGSDLYYFVNESAERYTGTVTVPQTGSCYVYNAWDNVLERAESVQKEDCTEIALVLEPRKGYLLLFDTPEGELRRPVLPVGREIPLKDGWKRSTCEAIRYPDFDGAKEVSLPDRVEKEMPDFGGFVRYEREVELPERKDGKRIVLRITGDCEGVEVFVNGTSAGIQIVPEYRFDLTGLVKEGCNRIVIEVATTLERVVPDARRYPGTTPPKPENACGINGSVSLYLEE